MKTLLLAAALAFSAGAASAAIDVMGSGIGHDCFVFARDGQLADTSVASCDAALASGELSQRDRAATLINRGVLRLKRKEYAEGLTDFDGAIGLSPRMAEAYLDRGAALVMLGRHADAIASIDRGLALGPGEPENGYFIRAMARERSGDTKGAYADFRKAAELAPKWTRPQHELRRFAVRKPG